VPPLQFVPLLKRPGLSCRPVPGAAPARRSITAAGEAGLAPAQGRRQRIAIQLRQRDSSNRRALDRRGFRPTAIDLELTESLVMEDIDASIEKLSALPAARIGTPSTTRHRHSSLFYLARLPVEALKIDRSFSPHGRGSDSMTSSRR